MTKFCELTAECGRGELTLLCKVTVDGKARLASFNSVTVDLYEQADRNVIARIIRDELRLALKEPALELVEVRPRPLTAITG